MSSSAPANAKHTKAEATAASDLTDQRFRAAFNAMRLAGEMVDVVITVGKEDKQIFAHKIILAGCSPYFGGMFRRGGFDESSSPNVRIDPEGQLGLKAYAVQALVDYIYTGKVDVSHSNAFDLVRAADMFQLTEVKKTTLRVLQTHISFESYLDIREVGTVFNSPKLVGAVDRFVRRNFSDFVKKPAFLDLSESRLTEYLSHPNVRTPTEETVLEAVLSWCVHNDALASFTTLAGHVRFGMISTKYLLRMFRYNEHVRNNTHVLNAILERMESVPQLASLSRPRFSTQVLVAMPYRSRTFFLISFHGDSFEFSVKSFPDEIHEHIDALINYCVCRVGVRSLFVAGGTGYTATNDAFYSDRAFLYDVIDDKWKACTPLPGHYNNFGVAAVGQHVYLMSGDSPDGQSSDELFRLNTAETDAQWQSMPRSGLGRSSVELASLDGKLIAIGGMLDGGYSSVVEAYEPGTDTWIELDAMNQARCNPGVAVANSHLYVVGGLGDNLLGPPGALKSVEVYDPAIDQWSSLPDMYFARHSPAVAVVNSRLFVFGGGSPSPLLRPGPERTIECFDFEKHEWFMLEMKIPGRSNAIYVADYFDNLDG